MTPHPALFAFALLAGCALIAAHLAPERWADGAARVLRHRAAPWVLGLATALACLWVAGGTLKVEPVSTDEASYLLEARILAAGHITAPAPPIPEFFEQAWVVVTPRIYSKYPPGHALALVPGVALGLPWLVPLLLNLVSGALLFALLRRAIGPAAALLTWSAWVLSVMAMAWQTTYFSEVTLLACWLGATSCVWRWLDGAGSRWLVGAALLTAFGAITRPLSILLLALPLIIVVLRRAWLERLGGELLRAAAAGLVILMVLPAWNLATTGKIGRSPLQEYTETYLPWDRLGFAVESTAARRSAPPDLQFIAPQLARVHREHTVARLPRTLVERAAKIGEALFTHWRVLLLAAALGGIWLLRGAAWVVLAAALSQFFGHAVWGHEAGWTLYYAESAAAWFVPGAVGVVAAITWLARSAHQRGPSAARAELTVLLAAPGLFLFSIADAGGYRAWRAGRAAESRALAEYMATGPDHAVYFIRYGPAREGRPGLVRNDPWLAGARSWVVYDLGARNEELLRAAPDRRGFLVDVSAHSVTPIPPPAAATPPVATPTKPSPPGATGSAGPKGTRSPG